MFALKYLEDLRERDGIELHQPGLLSLKDFSNTVAPGRTIESKKIETVATQFFVWTSNRVP